MNDEWGSGKSRGNLNAMDKKEALNVVTEQPSKCQPVAELAQLPC